MKGDKVIVVILFDDFIQQQGQHDQKALLGFTAGGRMDCLSWFSSIILSRLNREKVDLLNRGWLRNEGKQ